MYWIMSLTEHSTKNSHYDYTTCVHRTQLHHMRWGYHPALETSEHWSIGSLLIVIVLYVIWLNLTNCFFNTKVINLHLSHSFTYRSHLPKITTTRPHLTHPSIPWVSLSVWSWVWSVLTTNYACSLLTVVCDDTSANIHRTLLMCTLVHTRHQPSVHMHIRSECSTLSHTHIHTCVHTYKTNTHKQTHVHTCTHTQTHMRAHIQDTHTHVCQHVHTHTHTHLPTCTAKSIATAKDTPTPRVPPMMANNSQYSLMGRKGGFWR